MAVDLEDTAAAVETGAVQGTGAETLRVFPNGCASCEADWLSRSKEAEDAEMARLEELRRENLPELGREIWEYGELLNATQRQELALEPDVLLRKFILSSCTPPTPLMERAFAATMQRVPYEQACYVCGPEQAMVLRTLVGLARPRSALDIGSFTGYGASAIVEALPKEADLFCLELDRDYSRLAAATLSGRRVNFCVGNALDALKRFEAEGREFDFVCIDADRPNHEAYFNSALKLLRPGGVIIMLGMLLFPTAEDQVAMEKLHETLPADQRISTAQLPLGCGIQFMVKKDGMPLREKLGAEELAARRKWQLEAEAAAIDRYLDSLGAPASAAGSSGPGCEALTSQGLVALAAARRYAEQVAAEPPQ